MKRTWTYFLGAVILSAYLLVTNGAPPLAVAAGIAGAAMFVWRTSRARRS